MNLNLRATQQNTFDAIVVGSGISGGWAAKELCEKGLKVLLLERGGPVEHPNYPTASNDPWSFAHRGRLTVADRENQHVQVRHPSINEENKHFFINDKDNPYAETQRFDWIRGDVVGRRANGLYIPRFRNVQEKDARFVRGYGYQGGANRTGWASASGELGIALKQAAQQPGPWRIAFSGFGECLPYEENRATLNTDLKDKWGRSTLTLNVSFKENEVAMSKDMAEAMAEMLNAVGYKNVQSYQNMSFPGNTNHEMGSARMGRDPKTSVLNAFNQMHAVKNVFISDGSFMTSSGCVNPSLTYMAMTARACAYAVEQLNQQNI